MLVVVGFQFVAAMGVFVRFHVVARMVVGVLRGVAVAVVVGMGMLVDVLVGVGVGVFVGMNGVAVPVLVLVGVGVLVGVNVLVFVTSAHGRLHPPVGPAANNGSAIGGAHKAAPVPHFRCVRRTRMLPIFSSL